MDGNAIQTLYDRFAAPETQAGRVFTPAGWTEAKADHFIVDPLQVGTLTGFTDYVEANRDGLTLAELVVHVKEPGRVELRAKIEGHAEKYRRNTYLVASTGLVGGPALQWATYVDAETFYIALQAGFVATPDRDQLLTIIASIRENSVREVVDDGVSQEVKTGKGVAIVGNTRIPKRVTLAPYRTFREVEQPASPFVLRLQPAPQGSDRPRLALFEADGGAWKLDAIKLVARYLRAAIGEKVTVIA